MERRVKRNYKNTKLRQQVWDYMRRNPLFRVGDVAMLIEINQHTLDRYLLALKRAGYIRREDKNWLVKEHIYTLKKISGVKAPTFSCGELYDYNTKESFSIGEKR